VYLVPPRSENFWNLPTKVTQIDCILFCPRGILEFASTKATQIDCILFCRVARIFEFANKSIQ
jgi:hypothetical protein